MRIEITDRRSDRIAAAVATACAWKIVVEDAVARLFAQPPAPIHAPSDPPR